MSTENSARNGPPPIYIVSGGAGASGEQLVHTVLAQFPENHVPVNTVSSVRYRAQLEDVVEQARQSGGAIVHTLVDGSLRRELVELAREKDVPAFDLVDPLLNWLTEKLGREPLGQPGLYRRLRQDYYERVAAIEYTLAHDDGKNPAGWHQAQIVLTGVSRTGKTPLSIYLSVLGWKVANVPLVPGLPPPAELFELDPRRVIGLTIEPGQLIHHRRQRQRRLGTGENSSYVDADAVYEELRAAKRIMRQAGFSLIDVTDKPIESSAEEVIRLITKVETEGSQDRP
ncbi:MAG: kinase/pyrophosphorylase [Chloroflexi bacterium]|jgi:regulator of PEP synthase PpsR (kinase-PPPase family)|nr:kinase/pyrophosphorylase [Chloroflexota bacterium]